MGESYAKTLDLHIHIDDNGYINKSTSKQEGKIQMAKNTDRKSMTNLRDITDVLAESNVEMYQAQKDSGADLRFAETHIVSDDDGFRVTAKTGQRDMRHDSNNPDRLTLDGKLDRRYSKNNPNAGAKKVLTARSSLSSAWLSLIVFSTILSPAAT